MKFIFLINNIRISSGGPPRVASVVSAGLIERGNSVTIITKEKNHEEEYKFRDEVEIIRVSYFKFKSYKILRSELSSSDALIAIGIWGVFEGLLLKLFRRKSAKLFIRTCGMLEPYILKKGKLKKKIAWNFYVKSNLYNANALLPNTAIESGNLAKLNIPTPSIVVPNGVRLPKSKDFLNKHDALNILGIKIPPGESVILFMSRLHPKKGIDLLVKAFCDFSRKKDKWVLVVAGPQEDIKYVNKIKSEIPDSVINKIYFVGEVHSDKKAACFSIASFFVLPSHSEGFPNVVIEALAWGIPALVTPGCNFPELSHSGAGIEVESTIEKIHEGLHEMCELTSQPNIKDKAIKLAEQFNLDVVLDKYESLS